MLQKYGRGEFASTLRFLRRGQPLARWEYSSRRNQDKTPLAPKLVIGKYIGISPHRITLNGLSPTPKVVVIDESNDVETRQAIGVQGGIKDVTAVIDSVVAAFLQGIPEGKIKDPHERSAGGDSCVDGLNLVFEQGWVTVEEFADDHAGVLAPASQIIQQLRDKFWWKVFHGIHPQAADPDVG